MLLHGQDFIAIVEATMFFKEITYKGMKCNHELLRGGDY